MTAGALPGGHAARRGAAPGRAVRTGRAGRTGHRARGGHRRAPGAGNTSSASSLAVRILACASCCLLAAVAVKENYLLRGVEADLASKVVGFVTSSPAGAIPQTPTFWFTLSRHHEMGLEITPACTVVLMMTPFLIATAFLVWRKSSVLRPVTACLIAIAMLLVVNQLRILTIILFVLKLGFNGGFYWGHTLIGSLVTIIGGSATLVVYALIAVRRGSPARPRRLAR
jgi:exosortase/archaeosortase family protein